MVLQSKVHPDIWKIAISIPIYKNGERTQPSNEGGVTLNSALGKLFCQMLNERMKDFLEYNNIVAREQAGLRKKVQNHRPRLYSKECNWSGDENKTQ